MDYEDDDYSQYQQYEDELYKDPGSDSGGSDEVDSDLEDTMLSHVYYSTNVYKKAAASSAKQPEGRSINSGSRSSSPVNNNTSRDSHPPATAAEDYHQTISRETEQDSETDDDTQEASKQAKASSRIASSNVIEQPLNPEDQEESRYNVEKKRRVGQRTEWDSHATTPKPVEDDDAASVHTQENDAPEESKDDPVDDDRDADEDDSESDMPVKRARILDDEGRLNEHVLVLGAPDGGKDGDDKDYDLEAELGHLEDERFKGRSRYYMEKDREIVCFKCNQTGHIGRDCMTKMCTVCGAKNEHVAIECPYSACFNCRKKGHISDNCPYPRGYGEHRYCDKCGSKIHATEDCPSVWREYVCTSQRSIQDVNQYCYNCGTNGHFGDECRLPRLFNGKADGSAFSIRPNARMKLNLDSSSKADISSALAHGPSTLLTQGSSALLASRGNSSHSASVEKRDYRSSSSRQDTHDRGHESRDHSSKRDYGRNRDRDRDRDRDRGRDRNRDRDRDRDRNRGRDKDWDRDRDRNHNRSSYQEKNKQKMDNYQRTYKDLDSDQQDDYSKVDDDFDQEYLHQRSKTAGNSNNGYDNEKKFKKAQKEELSRDKAKNKFSGGGSSSGSNGPTITLTTAGGISRSIAGNSGTSDDPLVIPDSSPSPSVHSDRGYKLHSSLPDNPNRRAHNNGGSSRSGQDRTQGAAARQSLAELNAFPRGGGHEGRNNGSASSGNALIGVPPKPSGPMYTGGYSRRR